VTFKIYFVKNWTPNWDQFWKFFWLTVYSHIVKHQGDQIRRIFAYWAIVYFGHFFEKYRRSPNFFHGQRRVLILTKNVLGYILGDSNSSGVDVMITIFCDFCQFSAKKIGVFLKTNVMIKVLHNSALFRVKNANCFLRFFWQKYLKNHNIGPWSPC
jgi:hypothetical protein